MHSLHVTKIAMTSMMTSSQLTELDTVTVTSFIKIKEDMDHVFHQDDDVFLLLLEVSAAFDTIHHENLLHRLEFTIGLTGADGGTHVS